MSYYKPNIVEEDFRYLNFELVGHHFPLNLISNTVVNFVGFYFVSSLTKQGIEELTNKLIEVTLQQTYIGESIPEVWLNLEKKISEINKDLSVIPYKDIANLAESCGIIDSQEIYQAIKFLNDLGSLQYFDNKALKEFIVVDPQWIIDVMACVVSVKQKCIVDGKLLYENIPLLWNDFSPTLHTWMLKLTEEFDLTFPVPNQPMSIVPCLLPEKVPNFEWPEIDQNSPIKIKEFKVIYNFVYLPPGLFNRLQVRLYQYAGSTKIWKNGSLLRKNNHLALLIQTKLTIEVKVQGVKPENIVFVIHEVIEILINESFNGIQYDYSFPCPECVAKQSSEPFMFSSTILRLSIELKAPFLQCQRFFHAISIEELLAIMPIDSTSNLDLSLEFSLRDLKQLKNNLKYDILFWYCVNDEVQNSEQTSIDPKRVLETLKKDYKNIWYSNDPRNVKMDQITLAIKESKMVILCISDEFSKDETCLRIFELVQNIIKKNYLIVEFGKLGERNWLSNPTFASICSDYRVIMQDPKRFSYKILEIYESLERILVDTKAEEVSEEPADVFISYCWSNSHDAVNKGTKATKTSLGWLDPRSLVEFFKKNNINAWIDVSQTTTSHGLFGEITKGMNSASVIVACISDEYALSKNCLLEFRFAHCSLKLPIIKAIVGLGNEWKRQEISFLSGSYPEVNFQYENPYAYSNLLEFVKDELEKAKLKKQKEQDNKKITEKELADNNTTAFQELYELMQRKFLKQLIQFCDQDSAGTNYPRLFCIDYLSSGKVEDRKKHIEEDNLKNDFNDQDSVICIRPMCEFEEQWHCSPAYVTIDYLDSEHIFCSYLARIMNILKNSSFASESLIFLSKKGNNLMNIIEDGAKINEANIIHSYNALRRDFIEQLENKKIQRINGEVGSKPDQTFKKNKNEILDLVKCEMKNGKISWLCKEHCELSGGTILDDFFDITTNVKENKSKMLLDINDVNLEI